MVTRMEPASTSAGERVETIVIGGGQAGLSAGYFLSQQGREFAILDQNTHTGDSWRNRWDSLKLFTPVQFDLLPGMELNKPEGYLPSKNETAYFLENYARDHKLPVRHGVHVDRLERSQTGYVVTSDAGRFEAHNVIVATGPYQTPNIPAYARDLSPTIFQLHTQHYKNPEQVPAHNVLVVGAGNSGMEIAIELRRTGRNVWLSGRDVGRLPINAPIGRAFHGRLLWWSMMNLLSLRTPFGRRMKNRMLKHGAPLGSVSREDCLRTGVVLLPRMAGVSDGKPRMVDGQVLPADAVIWATGYRPDFRWIHLPIFTEDGFPRQSLGVVEEAPGLYFLGLQFQSGLSSSLLGGVGRDAAYITNLVYRGRPL